MDLCPMGLFYISRYTSWNIFVITQHTPVRCSALAAGQVKYFSMHVHKNVTL